MATSRKTAYTTTHPETGETITASKGGRPIKWFTYIDFGKGAGLEWLGYSSADSYAKAATAARGTNRYGIRYDATPAALVTDEPSGVTVLEFSLGRLLTTGR